MSQEREPHTVAELIEQLQGLVRANPRLAGYGVVVERRGGHAPVDWSGLVFIDNATDRLEIQG